MSFAFKPGFCAGWTNQVVEVAESGHASRAHHIETRGDSGERRRDYSGTRALKAPGDPSAPSPRRPDSIVVTRRPGRRALVTAPGMSGGRGECAAKK